MARSSNKFGNKVDNSAQYATEVHLSRRSFDDAKRVSNALEREADYQAAINNYEMARFLCDVSETLGVAGLERIAKDIRNG